MSVFGGDVLQSAIQDPLGNGGSIPGGWPNGRRFGDDVLDIAVTALISDLRGPIIIRGPAGDNLNSNDIGYNKTFPPRGDATERTQSRTSKRKSRFFKLGCKRD